MKRLLATAAALSLLLAPVAIAADDSPYFIGKREFKKQFRTIALAPVDSDPALEIPESVVPIIEKEIAARFEKRGHEVLPASVLGDIRRTMEQQVGGIVDKESGRIDEARLRAVTEHSLRELWFRHDIDAVAIIRIKVRHADVESDKAKWDGVKQKVERDGRRLKYTARVAASSVSLAIFDVRYRPLYVAYGGLEMLMKRVGEKFEPLDASLYFQDEKRIRKAARLAVKEI